LRHCAASGDSRKRQTGTEQSHTGKTHCAASNQGNCEPGRGLVELICCCESRT
jgi:hypothetical protein